MLKTTEQILFTIKNSNKMLIDVNTQVKKPIEHKTFYKKKKSNSPTKIPKYYSKNIHKSDNNMNTRYKNSLKKS